MKKNLVFIFSFLAIWFLLSFLAFNKHSKSKIFKYNSELWSDKAGYYVYLPLVFNYKLQGNCFPDSLDYKTGKGFEIDKNKNIVITKYFLGVAMMQFPFYLFAETIQKLKEENSSGFDLIHHKMINIAGPFYAAMGLIFLYVFLSSYFQKIIAFLAVFFILVGTNLYYYVIDEPGMSHVYSFGLFALILWFFENLHKILSSRLILLIFGFVLGLAIFVRPTNLLFLFLTFVFFQFVLQKNIFKHFVSLKPIDFFILIASSSIPLILQMFYWKYAYGLWIIYPYINEGFLWLKPAIKVFLLAPYNGLLLYTPFFVILCLIFVYLLFTEKHRLLGLFFIFSVFLLIFVFSSWWNPTYGCSFGQRNLVEYLTIFSFPFALLIQKLFYAKKLIFAIFMLVLIFVSFININFAYVFDECFYGHLWEWSKYFEYYSKMF